jgi:hypothetical protein
VVYPLAGSMHPINLGDVTFQWSQGQPGNRVFRIRFTGAFSYDFYLPCTRAQCIYQMPAQAWLAMAAGERGKPVTFTVADNDGGGGKLWSSAPVTQGAAVHHARLGHQPGRVRRLPQRQP